MLEKPSSSVQNQGSPFTKAALAGSVFDILIPMKRRGDLMLRQQGARTGSQAYRRQLNPLDQPLLLVVGNSDPEWGVHMEKQCTVGNMTIGNTL